MNKLLGKWILLLLCFAFTLPFAATHKMLGKTVIPGPKEKIAIIKPAPLKSGDTVGLVSSGFRAPENIIIEFATERLQALGLKVKYGKSIFRRDGYFAGTDAERAADINDMFADPEVKAIFEVRGGWGSNRIIDHLDYELIKKNPKILVGFSDITSLLLAIHAKTGLVTYHGPLGEKPWPEFTVNYLRQVLFAGEQVTFENPKHIDLAVDLIQTKNRIQTIKGGKATGRLLGGNLTVLTSMLGSDFLPNWDGAILFVEDVAEDYYQIDRMMTQLKLAGVLDRIAGFIFGKCTQCSVGSGTTTYGSFTLMQVLKQHIEPLGIPAWYGAMIGHDPEIFTLAEGLKVRIDADKGTIEMLEKGVK